MKLITPKSAKILSVALAFFLGLNLLCAQNPGNVGTNNLTAWFKSDSLTTGNIQYWLSSFPKGASTVVLSDTSGAPFPQVVNSGGLLNYNTAISFAGNSTTNVLMLGKLGTVNLIDNNLSTSAGSFIMVYYLPSFTATGGHMMHYRESGNDGIQFRHLGTVTRCAIGTGTASANASRDHNEDYKPMIYTYTGNRSTTTSMSAYRRGKLFTGGAASGTTGDNGIIVGARLNGGVYAGMYEGYVAEFMFYNKTLSAAELDRVHSYLAIKYGITIDNTGGGNQGNYTAANGSNIWAAANNSVYHNNIIALARDDKQSLYQKQSHTLTDSLRVYLNFLALNNEQNFSNIFNDSSYLLIGDNKGSVSATALANAEVPASSGVIARLEREWKLQNTNFVNAFNLDIKLDSTINPLQVSANDLVLLVDEDGNFTNATVFGQSSGLTFTVNNGTVTIAGISNLHIPMDSVRYITLGSTNINTPLPVKFLSLTAQQTKKGNLISWSTASEINNKYFTVEVSANNSVFNGLALVNASKNSNKVNHYSFIDENSYANSDLYYRIKQTDIDGTISYSNAVKLNSETSEDISVQPTVTDKFLTVTSKNSVNENFKIISLHGQDLTERVAVNSPTTNGLTLDVSQLPAGCYILILNQTKVKFIRN